MRDDERLTDREHIALDPMSQNEPDALSPPDDGSGDDEPYDESLTEEIAALIDDGRTYVNAELAFQKTRAKIAGKNIGKAAIFAAVALITLHISILALAVGLVIALAPLVSIWGAIAIVVSVLLLGTVYLAIKARRHIRRLKVMFSSQKPGTDA